MQTTLEAKQVFKTKEDYLNNIIKIREDLYENYLVNKGGVDDGNFDFGDELSYYGYTEEVIVGYYLYYYGDEALKEWTINSEQSLIAFPTDEGVTKILTELFE